LRRGAHESDLLMAEVTILPDGVTVTAGEDETLIRALSRAGLRYRVGCKRGGCGVCKVLLKFGEVRYERPVADTVLTDDERVEGICLSCRAVPLGNLVIELQENDRLRRVLGFIHPGCATTSRDRAAAGPTTKNEGEQESDG
jgi:ferredoxin